MCFWEMKLCLLSRDQLWRAAKAKTEKPPEKPKKGKEKAKASKCCGCFCWWRLCCLMRGHGYRFRGPSISSHRASMGENKTFESTTSFQDFFCTSKCPFKVKHIVRTSRLLKGCWAQYIYFFTNGTPNCGLVRESPPINHWSFRFRNYRKICPDLFIAIIFGACHGPHFTTTATHIRKAQRPFRVFTGQEDAQACRRRNKKTMDSMDLSQNSWITSWSYFLTIFFGSKLWHLKIPTTNHPSKSYLVGVFESLVYT